MTKPTSPIDDRRFARDVAKQLDRRRLRRRLLLWTALLAVLIYAVLHLRFGVGFGLGGGEGTGGDEEVAPRPVAGPLRCAIRLTSSGIAIGGKPRSLPDAVAACKRLGGADVLVTGDARHGDRDELIKALREAGVTDIVTHEPGANAPATSSGSGASPAN